MHIQSRLVNSLSGGQTGTRTRHTVSLPHTALRPPVTAERPGPAPDHRSRSQPAGTTLAPRWKLSSFLLGAHTKKQDCKEAAGGRETLESGVVEWISVAFGIK